MRLLNMCMRIHLLSRPSIHGFVGFALTTKLLRGCLGGYKTSLFQLLLNLSTFHFFFRTFHFLQSRLTSLHSFKMLSPTFLAALVAVSASSATALSGEATFYGGNTQGGMCSFSAYTIPDGIYGTALSDSNWDDSEACGGCVKVTGPNDNSITAMVRILA